MADGQDGLTPLDFKDPFAPAPAPTSAASPVLTRPAQPIKLDFADPFEQAASAAARATHSTLGDIGRSALGALETGTGEGLQGIGDVTGWKGAQDLGKRVQAAGARQAANVSPQFAETTSKPILSREGFNLTNIGSKAINTVAGMAPQLAATLAAGALTAEAGGVGAIPVGAALFGTQGEAAGRNAGEEQVAALTPEEISKVPAYQQAIAAGASPEQARAQLSERAANRGAWTSGLFGAGLGVAGEIPGVGALGRTVASKLARPIGQTAADVVGKGIGEGVGFGGINAAGQVASNIANPVPTPALENVGEAAASGVLPGFVLGAGRAGITHLVRPSGPLGRAAQTAQETGAAEPYPGAAPGSLADVANVLHRNAPVDTTGGVTSTAEPAASAPTGDQSTSGPALRVRVPPPLAPWVDAATGEATPPSDNQVLLALHQLRDQTDALRAEGKNPMVSRPQLAAAWGIPTKRLSGLMTTANAERRRGVTTTDAQTRLDQNPGDVPQVDPAEQMRANNAADDAAVRQLRTEQDAQLDATDQSLADIRARLNTLREQQGSETATSNDVAKPEQAPTASEAPQGPDATARPVSEPAPAAPEPAPPVAADTRAAEPATTPDALPAAEAAAAAPSVASEPARAPEPVAAPEAGAPPARAAATSESADQAAREVPVSSSESSDKGGVAAETTLNVSENQLNSSEQSALAHNDSSAATPALQSDATVKRAVADRPATQAAEVAPAPEFPSFKDWAQQQRDAVSAANAAKATRRDQLLARIADTRDSLKRAMPKADRDLLKKQLKGDRIEATAIAPDTLLPPDAPERDITRARYERAKAAASKARERPIEAVVAPGDRVTVTRGVHTGKSASVVGRTRNGVRLKFADGTQATLSAKVMERSAKPDNGQAATQSTGNASAFPRGLGARRSVPEGAARVEAARRALRDAINDPGLTGAKRAGTIENLRERVQFMETHAGKRELPKRSAAVKDASEAAAAQMTEAADAAPTAVRAKAPVKDAGASVRDINGIVATDKSAAGNQGDRAAGGESRRGPAIDRPISVNPETLRFREPVQSRLDETRAFFPDDEYLPVVAIYESNGERTILDGHNRTAVAIERAHKIPVVDVTRKEYDGLRSRGYDDMEIAYAALSRARAVDAANALGQQFNGSNIVDRGLEAESWLDSETAPALPGARSQAREVGRATETPPKGGVSASGAITDIGEKIGGARKDTAVKGAPARKRAVTEAEGGDNAPGWRKRYEVAQIAKSSNPKEEGRWSIHDKRQNGLMRYLSGRDVTSRTFATKAEAEAAVPLIEVARNHRTGMRDTDNWGIYRRVGDRKRVWVKDGFKTDEDAMRYMAQHAVDLIETKTSIGEEALPKPDTVTRTGPGRRTGDVAPEQFRDAFGFRGVEFGNWNNQAERQEVMNHAFDGLHDLAELLGIPPKAISLNGELGLAFGARGQGLTGARAHYERGRVVMNLTKMQGAGALAHEWFHALDHYLSRQGGASSKEWTTLPDGTRRLNASGTPRDFASYAHSERSAPLLRAELRDAFGTLIQTMQRTATTFVRDSGKLEQFTGRARADLEQQLARLRDGLATEARWGAKGKRAPASAEQLAEFDAIAAKLVHGDGLDLRREDNKPAPGRRLSGSVRTTNDDLERLSAILKAVRGRSGFTAQGGPLVDIANAIRRYDVRLKEAADAKVNPVAPATKPTSFRMEAVKADQGRGTDYWSTRHEMAARAFSAYVEDRLKAAGRNSDFLSYGSDARFVLPIPELPHPFPQGEERVAIDKAFDTFFKTVKTREDEAGHVAMFSRLAGQSAGARGRGIDAAQLDRRVSFITRAWHGDKPNVRVVDGAEQLPPAARAEGGYERAEGYYDGKDTIYLVRENLRTAADVDRVLARHEVTHYGLDRIMDDAVPGGWKRMTDEVAGWRKDPSGLDDATRKALLSTEERYRNAYGSPASPDVFAAELPAVMAEQGVRNSLLDRVVAAVRAHLRKWFPNLKLSPREVRQFIVQANALVAGDGRVAREQARKQHAMVAAHAFDKAPDMFYSALNRAVALGKGMPKKADATAWKQWLDGAQRRGEFKGAEREWLGLDQWLDEHKGPVTRQELADYVRDNQVQVREVMHRDEVPAREGADLRENEDGGFDLLDNEGAGAGTTRFGDYTLPGGTNYRELLLQLPSRETADRGGYRVHRDPATDKYYVEKDGTAFKESTRVKSGFDSLPDAQRWVDKQTGEVEPFKGPHFDEPNILAHVRMNDRTGPDGEKILHVEEVQSDWHQAGRKRGYNVDQLMPDGSTRAPTTGVPDAPFKKTEQWSMLAMKRVLRYAADHGYDKVTWTTGEQQAERYDQSHQLKSIHVTAQGDPAPRLVTMDTNRGPIRLFVDKDGRVASSTASNARLRGQQLDDVIGKELATKVMEAPDNTTLAGNDLKFGGEGMKAYYDRMLPNELNKYAKQWGAKVGKSTIETRPARVLRNELDLTDLGAPAPRDSGTHIEPAQTATVHSIDITPAMRDSVQQGQPLFSRKVEDDGPHGPVFEAKDYRTAVDTLLREKTGEVKGALFNEKSGPVDLVYGKAGSAENRYADGYGLAKILAKHPDVDPYALADELLAAKATAPHGNTWQFEGQNYRMVLKRDWLGEKKTWLLTAFTPKDKVATDSTRIDAAANVRAGATRPTQDATSRSIARQDDAVNAAPAEKSHVAFSKPDPNAPSDPSREPHKTIADVEAVLKHGDPAGVREQAKGWLRGKLEDFRPALLGALQTGHILELMEDVPALKGAGRHYNDLMHQMAADREHLMVGAPDAKEHPGDVLKKGAVNIADELRKFTYGNGFGAMRGKVRPEAQQLFDLMHQATIQRLDPSKVYERLTIENAHGDAVPWTHEEVKKRLRLLKELAMQRGGDPWADREKLRDEVIYLRNIAKAERKREQNWPKLQADYLALPEEGKRLYAEVRDWYSAHRDETEKALIRNIEALDVPETYRRGLVQRMRLQFEAARREGVYFPLNRDGDYWIAFRDRDNNEGFKMFETAREYARGEKRLRAAGYQIDAKGRRDNNMKAKDAPSGTFVRAVIDTLQKARVSETVQDEVYQTFLRSLPELSMRKHSIHRKNVAGFSEDALRAFAKNGYHGSYQLARLRHAQDMEFALEGMKASVDNWRRGENATDQMAEPSAMDVAKADALVAEMQKRHDWIMRPTDQQLANMVNSLGFIYYLGASPASALTNLTQIAQTALPALGAAHGFPKAARYLSAAWRDAARTVGNMDRTLTNPEEKRAFLVMQQRGDFSKTQSHTLAGLAEGNALQASPAWSRVMNAVSWMFHKSEVINREATGMAAYRLARAEGKTFDQAVQYAGKANADTMFDYSSANRPRYMQGNVQRIALQFKNYSIGMSWLFYRNLYQAMKAADPETRRVARRTVTGILGMTAILAGTTGLPIYNTVRTAANAANALWGDDNEPWSFDDAFHRWLADNLGPDAARLIAEGPSNYLTGANIASRTSMSNLWIHDDDQRLEGADAYHALLEALAGPIGGITNNFYVGAEDVRRGHVERGVERVLPSSVKNTIKAFRFANEGVNNLRGDPIVPDISGWEQFIQAVGFQPANVANQYRINTAAKNYTGELQDRRINLMNAYAMAIKAGDPDDRSLALQKITAFNQAHPEIAISAGTLRRSLQQRARLSAQATNGVQLNRKLAAQALQYAGAAQ